MFGPLCRRGAGLTQRPRRKFVDQAGFLSNGDEPFGRNHTVRLMNPHGRGLEPDHLAALEVEAGLVNRADAAVFQCDAQIRLQLVAFTHLAVHLRFEEA